MGGSRLKGRRLVHGRLNTAESERLNNSTCMRRVSRARRLAWALALTTGVNMGIGGVAVLPKVAAAQIKSTEDILKKSNSVYEAADALDKVFQKQEKKGKIPGVTILTSPEAQELMKAVDAYLAMFEDIKLEGKGSERVKDLNEKLGVDTDNPDFIVPKTLDALEAKMIELGASMQDKALDEAAKETAEAKPEEVEKPVEEAVEKPKPTEAVPEVLPPALAPALPEYEAIVNDIDMYIGLCDKYSLDPKLKKKLEDYKGQVLEKQKEKKPISEKLTKEIDGMLSAIEAKVESELKKAEEAEKEVPTMTDKEKAVYYKSLMELLGSKTIFKKPLKVKGKKVIGLPEGKELTKDEKKLFISASKKIKKGDLLSPEEEAVFLDVAISKLRESTGVLNGMPQEKFAELLEQAVKTNNPTYLKDATSLLNEEVTFMIELSAYYIKNQINVLDKYRKKHKLEKKPIKLPKGYNLTTVSGVMESLQWVYDKEIELIASMVEKQEGKAELSPEAEATIEQIAELRTLRAKILGMEGTVQTITPEEYEAVLKDKKRKKGALMPVDLSMSIGMLKQAIELVSATNPDEPALEVAKKFLSKTRSTTPSSIYAKDPKKVLAAANYLIALAEYNLWHSISVELGKDPATVEKADAQVEFSEEVYAKNFSVTAPVMATPMLASTFVEGAITLLSPSILGFYELDVMAKGMGESKKEWITGIKGSIGFDVTNPEVFIPLLQTEYLRGEAGGSGIHPAWGRYTLDSPGFGTLVTDSEIYQSNYGPTVGLIEAQEEKLSPEEWDAYHKEIEGAASSYGEQFVDAIIPVTKVKTDIVNSKENDLVNLLNPYGIGLAPIPDYENSAVVVTTQMLDVFGERENATVENGKVTAIAGATLNAVELAGIFIGAASLVETKEKYEELKYKDAKKKSGELITFLENNLPPESMERPDVIRALGALKSITNKAEYVEALLTLQSVGDFGLSSVYMFETTEAEERFYWAKEVESSIGELKKLGFKESQLIALMDLAIDDVYALQALMDKSQISIYIPPQVKEPEIIETITEPPVLSLIGIDELNKKLSEGLVFKGSGDRFFRPPEEVGTLAEEGMSFFGNDEEKWVDYIAMVMEDLNYINSGETTPEESAQRANELATFLREHYSEDLRNIEDALEALDTGDLREGLKELRASGNAGIEALIKALGNSYVVELDEKGANVWGAGFAFRFNWEEASKDVWKALKGDEKLKKGVVYQLDLFYRWQRANMSAMFKERKIDPETMEYVLTGEMYPGEAKIDKHTTGAAVHIAADVKGGEKIQKAFGKVWMGTFTIALSLTDGVVQTKDPVPDKDEEGNPIPGSEKIIEVKGKQLSFGIIDFTMQFPGAAGPVRLENVGVGFVNVPLYKSETGPKVFNWSAYGNPLFHSVISIPLYETKTAEGLPDLFGENYHQVAVYAAPQFLVYMGDPTIFLDGGFRYIYSGSKFGAIVQLGTAGTFAITGKVTEGGEKIRWNAVKATAVLETGPLAYSISASYDQTDGNFAVLGGITFTPKKAADIVQGKREKEAKALIDTYIEACKKWELETELKRVEEFEALLNAGAMNKKELNNLKKLAKEIDAKVTALGETE